MELRDIVRGVILDALNETCGLYSRPDIMKSLNDSGDILLSDLDIDSLATYEIIMILEEKFEGVDFEPLEMLSAALSDLIDTVTRMVEAHDC